MITWLPLYRIDNVWFNGRFLDGSPYESGDSDPPASTSRHQFERLMCCRPKNNRILIVHGLELVSINCDRVFNLFCLYGNVMTVKILKDFKVLVELEDAEAAKRCVSNLHLLPLDNANRIKVK